VIAILGATGYIGSSLARRLAVEGKPLVLFARNPSRLADESWPDHVSLRSIADFDASEFALVVNAIGAGDPARVTAIGAEILDVTQAWDTRVLTTMRPETRYVFLSSGAVYGAFSAPVNESSEICLPVNRLGSVPPYTIAKLYAEARHRHAPDRAILDLRVFAYADSAIPLTARFFLAELARSVAEGAPFLTSPGDMVRDYAAADELADLIRCWRMAGAPNAAVDLYSKEPVGKLDLLGAVERRFGLKIEVQAQGSTDTSPTGAKPLYASHHFAASAFGYRPKRTSLEIVLQMLQAVHAAHERKQA
jgi:nucleoside-diphosphate-sugar epimerase